MNNHRNLSTTQVHNTIRIHAPRAAVWVEVVEAPTISDREWRIGWTTLAGLPTLREAALAGSGVGTVRTATFSDGLTFIERVVAWEDERHLHFTIAVDRSRPVPRPFKGIGGQYFDVIEGAYTLEEEVDGTILLVLESTPRVSMHFSLIAPLTREAALLGTR